MSMDQDDFLRTFLSSPQSFDVIEQTKKQIKKKKRKPVHKHLLIHNILLENDHSKLTFRQRILQKKFQSKNDEMEDIDLIRSGIDIIPFNINNKMVFKSKYKVKIPVSTKLRLKVSFKLDEFNYGNKDEGLIKEENLKSLKNEEEDIFDSDNDCIVNQNEEDILLSDNDCIVNQNEEGIFVSDNNYILNKDKLKNEEENILLSDNDYILNKNLEKKENSLKNEENIFVSDNDCIVNKILEEKENPLKIKEEIKNEICLKTDIIKYAKDKDKPQEYSGDIKTTCVINNEEYINPKKRQLSLYKDELNYKIYKILEQNKKEDKILTNNQICVYKKINIFELFKTKSTKKITRLSLDEVDIYEANNNLYISEEEDKKCEIVQDEISEKLEMINFNNVNKTMLIKKRKVLFKSEKKKNVDCINKAAYYITELEKIPKYTKNIEKKCIYYTDILIKEFKKKGCVCRVIGEVKWYIKKIKDEHSIGNISI